MCSLIVRMFCLFFPLCWQLMSSRSADSLLPASLGVCERSRHHPGRLPAQHDGGTVWQSHPGQPEGTHQFRDEIFCVHHIRMTVLTQPAPLHSLMFVSGFIPGYTGCRSGSGGLWSSQRIHRYCRQHRGKGEVTHHWKTQFNAKGSLKELFSLLWKHLVDLNVPEVIQQLMHCSLSLCSVGGEHWTGKLCCF